MSTVKTINVQHPSSASANITLDNSGNVGIGTSSPSVKLDVQQSISGGAGLTGRVYNPDTGATSAAYITAYQGTIQTGIYSYGNSGSYVGAISNNFVAFITNNTERMRLDTSGNLLFNSGYGSVATAYGCRAWVNMDGTQVAASMIRASGNVTSITDNGAGDYTVNFTTAMPNTNYAVTVGTALVASDPVPLAGASRTNNPIITNLATGSFSIGTVNAAGTAFVDAENIFLAVFR